MPTRDGDQTKRSRRSVLAGLGAASTFGLAGCVGGGGGGGGGGGTDDTIKFGALYALSGTVEVIGRPMMNSTELAVDQINENGGIDGRQVELVKADNASDPQTGIEESRTLVNDENCDMVFGAYSSAMRNAITNVYVENEVPLFYPTLYEGGVCASIQGAEGFSGQVNVPKEKLEWVWFNNAVPRQQIEPYIPWLMENEDIESFYLIGSDYVWPHTTNAVLDDFVEANGGTILQEDYVPLDFTDWGSKLTDIESADPDAVYFTTVGASQVAMIKQAADLGLTDEFVWAGNIMSEQEAQSAGEAADGIYTSAPYFTSLDTTENDDYIGGYRDKYGTDTTPNFVAEAAYWAPLMTAELLRENDPQASSPSQVKSALENEATLTVPQGEVTMNPGTHHCSVQSRVGQYDAASSEFEVLEEFGSLKASGITVEQNCLNS